MTRRKVQSIAEGRAPAPTGYPLAPPELPDYLRSSEVQRVLGVKASDIGRWISEGLLPVVATEVLFRMEDVRRFAQQHPEEYNLRRIDPHGLCLLLFEDLPETPSRRPSARKRTPSR